MTTQLISSGGIQTVFDDSAAVSQIIYLDFDGANTSYRGEILSVDDVKVEDSGLTAERIAAITAALNERFADQNVQFVSDPSELPASPETYSTIYVGKTSGFAPYGTFDGLAETVDHGNAKKDDNAFVILDSSSDDDQIVDMIAHEAGHLLGTLDHGGEGLTRYEYSLTSYLAEMTRLQGEYQSSVNDYQTSLKRSQYENMAYANNNLKNGETVVNWRVIRGSQQRVAAGATASLCTILGTQNVIGTAISCYVGNGGSQRIGGVASNTYLYGVGAVQNVVGTASETIVGNEASQYIAPGGRAVKTCVLSGGSMVIEYPNLNGSDPIKVISACINSGGVLLLSSGANRYYGEGVCISGCNTKLWDITYVAGAIRSVAQGTEGVFLGSDCQLINYGTFVFGVDQRTPSNYAIVDNIRNIRNAGGNFVITVTADQKAGKYVLAGDADTFSTSIAVFDADTGKSYGGLVVSKSFIHNERMYSLTLDSSNRLVFTISDDYDNVAPSRVTGVKSAISNYTNNSVTFSWDAASDSDSGVKEYEFRLASNSSFSSVVNSKTTSSLNCTVSNIADGTYYWQVRAVDKAGNKGEWSEVQSLAVGDYDAPTRVTGGRVSDNTEGRVTFAWDAASDSGSGVRYYEFRLASDTTFRSTVRTQTTSNLNCTVSGIANGTYYWQVRAVDNSGNSGEWSQTQSVTFLDDVAPAQIDTDKSDWSTDGYHLSCSWKAPVENGSGIQEYEVEVIHNTQTDHSTVCTKKTSALSADIVLEHGYYRWRVRAIDKAGNAGEWSTAAIINIYDEVAPSVPSGVSCRVSGNTLSASWNASADDSGGVGMKGYTVQISRDSDFKTIDKTLFSADTDLSVADLPNGHYYLRVTAQDKTGNKSVWSKTTQFSVSSSNAKYVSEAVSDYNGSGKSDMVQFVNGLVYVMYDTEDGYVQTPAINDITGWNVMEIRRDLTGDGYADVQITSDDGAGSTWVATLRNDYLQNGCITLSYQFIGAYNNRLWSYLGSADVNNDGKCEVLMVQTDAGADSCGHRNVAAWVTDENGIWVDNTWVGSLTSEWNIAGTADVTGSGEDNVLLRRTDGIVGYWSKSGTNDIVLLENQGGESMLTTGDFDGDGVEESLCLDDSGDLNTHRNDKWYVLNMASKMEKDWTFAGVGDYNVDGKDEILWCNTATCSLAYGACVSWAPKEWTVIA